MQMRNLVWLLAAGVVLGAPTPGLSQTPPQILLCISDQGFGGDENFGTFEDCSLVTAVSFGAGRALHQSGRTSSAACEPMVVTKAVDRASGRLSKRAMNGRPIDAMQIISMFDAELLEPGYVLSLEGVEVLRVTQALDHDELAVEDVTFLPESVELTVDGRNYTWRCSRFATEG